MYYLVAGVLGVVQVVLITCDEVSLKFGANLSGEKGPTMNRAAAAEPGTSSCLHHSRRYVPQTKR